MASSPGRANLRVASTVACLLAGAAILLRHLHHLYPIRHWIVWDFARIWAWQVVFCVAALSVGLAVVDRLLVAKPPRLADRLTIAMAVGTGVFAIGMMAGGAARLFGPVFATTLPIVLCVVGLRPLARAAREVRGWWREEAPALAPIPSLLGGAGAVALGLLYLQCLTPDSITYDAAWSHLTVAEDYSREGRIVPFPGSVPKTLPHLHSLLYTWCFIVPGLEHPALKWMASLHLEFLLFSWTLFALVPAVRWLANEGRGGGIAPAAWTARFLLPGVFVYDFNLGGGSDHVAGFFALPLLLLAVNAAETMAAGPMIATGFIAGAALHTKYQCVQMVGPVAAYLAFRIAVTRLRRARAAERDGVEVRLMRSITRGAGLVGVMVFGGVLSFGPHLVRNVIFYRNPIYPYLSSIFPSNPIYPDAASVVRYLGVAHDKLPPSAPIERIVSSLRLVALFPFNDVMSIFGAMTILLLPIALFLRGTSRLRLGFLLAGVAVFAWAFTYRTDRNLQQIVPWLAAVSGAAIVVAWRAGRAVRIAVAALILVQLTWGGRFVIAGGINRTRSSLEMIARDISRNPTGRYDSYRAQYRELGRAIPENGVLLLHMEHLHLGVNRTTLEDWAGSQHLIDYRPMRTARDVYNRFRQLGITHMAWNNFDYSASRAEDILFMTFASRYAINRGQPGGFSLWEMPSQPPPERPPIRVAVLGIPGYEDGLYEVGKLTTFDWYPPEAKNYPSPDLPATTPEERRLVLARSDVLLLATGGAPDADTAALVAACFTLEAQYHAGHGLHLRGDDSVCPPRSP